VTHSLCDNIVLLLYLTLSGNYGIVDDHPKEPSEGEGDAFTLPVRLEHESKKGFPNHCHTVDLIMQERQPFLRNSTEKTSVA
jgi:hypothetical protein